MTELGEPLGPEFYARDVHEVARDLLGCTVVSTIGGVTAGRIVEVEAYGGAPDPACHADRGTPTERTATMFGRPGHAYVYRIYGMYDCLNVVAARGEGDEAAAVLIRALEPIDGLELMRGRRGQDRVRALTTGPGKICQALAVTRDFDGHPLWEAPLRLFAGVVGGEVRQTPRIGLNPKTCGDSAAFEWRYIVAESRYLSR